MNPFFEELASTYTDVLFLTVDVDDVKDVASKMEVKAMPTFVLLKDGNQVDKLVGANPEGIKKRIDGFVQSSCGSLLLLWTLLLRNLVTVCKDFAEEHVSVAIISSYDIQLVGSSICHSIQEVRGKPAPVISYTGALIW
ncbi:hypothetical protein Ancab_005037 [Ancistrocladus abbreviatus]